VFTVATPAVPPLHVPFVDVLASVIVDPFAHICALPVIAAGTAFTVAVMLVADPQPLE
jgi:hypothetical protein